MLIALSPSFYAAIIAVPLNGNDSSNDGNYSGWRCWAQSACVTVLCRAIVVSVETLYLQEHFSNRGDCCMYLALSANV